MVNLLNKSMWVIFAVLTPLTFIGLFSQNAIPGDFLYPVKLGIEQVGLVVFSFNPALSATYNSDLAKRRFDEAQVLLVSKADTQGLSAFVTQTELAQESLNKVQNQQQKKEIQSQMIQAIDQYQQQLTEIQKNVDPTYIPPANSAQEPPGQIAYKTPSQNQTITQPTETPQVNNSRFQQLPTNTPIPTKENNLSQNATDTPSPIPNSTTTEPTQNLPPITIATSIENTKNQLSIIKKQVQQDLLSVPQQQNLENNSNSSPSQQQKSVPNDTIRKEQTDNQYKKLPEKSQENSIFHTNGVN